MSLGRRLHLLLAAVTLVFLLLGLWTIVHNARQAVAAELRSASELTGQLLQAHIQALGEMELDDAARDHLLTKIDSLGTHRHIRLELYHGIQAPPFHTRMPPRPAAVPAWFSYAVKPPVDVFYRSIRLDPTQEVWVLVHAEPADEIAEAWRGSRGLLALLLGFALLANLLAQLSLRRALRPLGDILTGLDRLRAGNYGSRLPRLRSPELDQVSREFNRLAEALASSRARNRQLNRRLLEVQEAERRHLARELHDEMGQCLTAIHAEAVAIARAAGDNDTRSAAEAIAGTASKVFDLTQTLIHRLHPAVLEELGLALALRQMMAEWGARHTHIRWRCEPLQALHIEPDLAIHLYRVTQECLTNIARHADASEVAISLWRSGSRICLKVRDNGRGFEPGAVPRGFGLLGMQERIASLNGRLRLASSRRGTLIAVTVPLARSGAAAESAVPALRWGPTGAADRPPVRVVPAAKHCSRASPCRFAGSAS
ncbi:hypothetical protein CAI21_17985 [Alkalilimnicola ehrlichii]|uniref:histidine kinase n=1 Tax=Alkalilimnicola ehrlichii TaxID=351052 RepID=A0A3E0WMA2_9GAMM|nr:ATP-binding protein [Alkalilimnicola ehrlichii]RFA25849.1 hypothetical protein CAI21_17985 [Alkalilimnicola ehrlichii]RFA33096.1 hypothetical protein CAL65_18195 [Alkalilimnicola ehrlichii]